LPVLTATTDVENLLQISDHSRDRHLFGPGPKRILALDGGGVRGAISVAFLERIEAIFEAYQRRLLTDYIAAQEQRARAGEAIDEPLLARAGEKLAAPFRLGDWFDLVGGTSTGALIAGAVALGFNTGDIKEFYLERAANVFKPGWRIPGLQVKFDAGALRKEIDAIVEDRTLDSDDLITGLCVVSKRLDTGSPWIIANNPRAPYWESRGRDPATKEMGHIGNRHYKLATLVRASTAAPSFFDPEILQIIEEDEGHLRATGPREQDWLERLSEKLSQFPQIKLLVTRWQARRVARRKAKHPNQDTHGMFVDGGLTPYNNPSLALLMQVVLKPYGLCWTLGPNNLSIVSIGTGSFRSRLSFEELGWARNIQIALNSLLSMMGDSQTQALALMQWLGETPNAWPINSEIGDLGKELPPGHHWFRFMRYDLPLETTWLNTTLGKSLDDATIARYRNMDDASIIQTIYELAAEAAALQVKKEHLLPKSGAGGQTASA
jgi:hypothetical protein